LKIALVILHADPARGGAETYTADLAAALAAREHRVSILASDFGSSIPGVEFVQLQNKAATRTAQTTRFLDSLQSHLAAEKYDIVHAMLPVRQCNVYHPHAGLALESVREGHRKHTGRVAQAAAKLGNRLNRKRQLFARVEYDLLNSPHPPVVLCLSDYVKQTVRRHYDLPKDKLATLFNAVDLGRFDSRKRDRFQDRQELKIQKDQIIALMVAQDFQRKGLRQTILALKQIKNPNLQLLVVGRDKPEPFKRLAKEIGVADQIHFIGPVSDTRPFYNAADFLVLPTSHDPCSLAVLESLAMGLPVISTVFNGACQIMETGKHGFVLEDPQNIAALSKAMQTLLDPKTREAMRTNCLSLRPQLSFDSHVDRLLEIYVSCKSLSQKSTAR